jgi:hypothetical protein
LSKTSQMIPTHFPKTAGKPVKIHWIPAHIGITRKEKADELAKHRIRHRRERQIPIPIYGGKNPKRNPICNTNPWFAKCKLNRRTVTSICKPLKWSHSPGTF